MRFRGRNFLWLALSACVVAAAPGTRAQSALSREDMEHRLRYDYSLTREQLFQEAQGALRGLTREEFDAWIKEGRFDKMNFGGEERFLDVGVRNLFFRYPELRARRIGGKDTLAEQRGRLETARAIAKAARESGSAYVLPHHYHATMTVTVEADAAPAGSMIRAWLPAPRKYPFQTDFSMGNASQALKSLAPEDSPIRSAYFEEPAAAGQPTVFQMEYDYTFYGIRFPLDAKKVAPANLDDPALRPYAQEGPHVVFTDEIRRLAREVAGGSKNPMVEARAFYDWIGTNVKYSFAREYSTLTNIGGYCLAHRYGDCGQEAMLFITLCRAQGIPARWQSGWDTFPGYKDIHDWTEIYLTPYGWVPVDPWAGLFAEQECDALTPAERAELHDFYFGGLDFYRMAANGDHSQALEPAKKFPRSDNVDFQRGEVESEVNNIYFDKFKTRWEVQEIHEAR